MWSDYELRHCGGCDRRMYHERGAAVCRSCQVTWRGQDSRGVVASPFTRRALAGDLIAKAVR